MLHPQRVFLDTDIGPDCDDTAALAILLEFCRQGHAELIGVTHCTGSPYGLAAIDAHCRLFGIQVPMGTCPDRTFLDCESTYCYTPAVAAAFPHGYPPENPQPDAVRTLTRALENAPDGSVTLVTIGPLNNIGRALRDPVLCELMHRKITQIISMAGNFESDSPAPEWNVLQDIEAARTLVRQWKGELLLVPYKPMDQILTGACLAHYPDNPVTVAYRLLTKGQMLRPSWDLSAVVAAVPGMNGPFVRSEPGTVSVDQDGISRFIPSPEGKHRYLTLSGSIEEGAAYLENLLEQAVRAMTTTL